MKLLVADPGDAALRDLVAAVFDRYARRGRGAELAGGAKADRDRAVRVNLAAGALRER